MKVIDTPLKDLKIIEPQVYKDERGFFLESFRDSWFKASVADVSFVQDNHCKSSFGILRGLHYQIKHAQGKLVRVISGEVFDVTVDMRKNSNTFGKSFACLLSAKNKRQLWIPAGFAHGFYVTSRTAEFVYKCTDYYAPQFEKNLFWNDPELKIDWPLGKVKPLLSSKDQAGLLFKNSEYYP